MKPDNAKSALLAGHRFVWIFWAMFGILLLAFWGANLHSPG